MATSFFLFGRRLFGFSFRQPAPRPRFKLPRRSCVGVETLEGRNLLSAAALHSVVNSAAHPGTINDAQHVEVARKSAFSVAQLKNLLPGKWHVDYDASSLFGPGARGVQEITFTGPKGTPTFISTSGVVVQGFTGPAYYQFSSWGTYQFLNKNLVRLTITGASPTEYLDRGIIVMGGQFMPIRFLDKNHFEVQGQTYTRVPLGSSVF